MKFYIISLVLNAMLVFVPIHHAITQAEEKTETINVSLDGEDFLSSEGGSPGGGYSGSGGTLSESQNNVETKSTTLESVNDKQTTTKTQQNDVVSKKDEKTPTALFSKSSEGTAKGSGNNKADSGSGSGSGGGSGNGFGEGSGNGQGSGHGEGSGNGKGSGNGNGSGNGGGQGSKPPVTNTNYACQEGKGYRISYNPTLEMPKAAERLGKTGSVRVSLTFNSNGSITVTGASGGNDILQSAAKKAAQNIKVTILDPQVTKCKVSKSFTFK